MSRVSLIPPLSIFRLDSRGISETQRLWVHGQLVLGHQPVLDGEGERCRQSEVVYRVCLTLSNGRRKIAVCKVKLDFINAPSLPLTDLWTPTHLIRLVEYYRLAFSGNQVRFVPSRLDL